MSSASALILILMSFGLNSAVDTEQTSAGVQFSPLQDIRGTMPIARDEPRGDGTDGLLMLLVAIGAFGLYFRRQYLMLSRSRHRIAMPADLLPSMRLLRRSSGDQMESSEQFERVEGPGLVDGTSTLKT